MIKYYTRACNFHYGKYSKFLINKKLALPLCGNKHISFDKIEINMINEKGFMKLTELYAVGPSISVLMDGYKERNGLTSLRGTLVPAKNLNRLLSKIPVIGDIIIPKEVGEGLFGVSFKMKGKTGEIKTTINPIKTLTPRFITKALEKTKKTKSNRISTLWS